MRRQGLSWLPEAAGELSLEQHLPQQANAHPPRGAGAADTEQVAGRTMARRAPRVNAAADCATPEAFV